MKEQITGGECGAGRGRREHGRESHHAGKGVEDDSRTKLIPFYQPEKVWRSVVASRIGG
jgi:hypothetical protein